MTPKKEEDPKDLSNLAGIGPATKSKLLEAGVRNIDDLIVVGTSGLAERTGMDFDKASEIIQIAIKYLITIRAMKEGIREASDILKDREEIDVIKTGASNLDELLHGGIETGAITEFYGAFGSGKTQICHMLCVMVQLPKDKGGLGGSALYVDSEGTFRPERIKSIAEQLGLDIEDVLHRVICAKVQNSGHQELVLTSIGDMIKERNIKLIVVDSAVAHYRSEFLGRGTLADRQQRLNSFMKILHRLAETFNIAVVITNQIIHSPDVLFGNPEVAVGGNIIAHASTYRIALRRAGKGGLRIAKFIDSPSHAESECPFLIYKGGIKDSESS